MKSRSTSEQRVNPRVQIQVSDLARSLYMSSTTLRRHSPCVEEILNLFENGGYDLSKKLYSDLLSSSLS